MQIRIFIGLTDFVEQRVNDFCKGVEVVDIQISTTGRDSVTATVIYKGGIEGWMRRLSPRKK